MTQAVLWWSLSILEKEEGLKGSSALSQAHPSCQNKCPLVLCWKKQKMIRKKMLKWSQSSQKSVHPPNSIITSKIKFQIGQLGVKSPNLSTLCCNDVVAQKPAQLPPPTKCLRWKVLSQSNSLGGLNMVTLSSGRCGVEFVKQKGSNWLQDYPIACISFSFFSVSDKAHHIMKSKMEFHQNRVMLG